MALIKGNKANPRGTVVLQGDQLLQAEPEPPRAPSLPAVERSLGAPAPAAAVPEPMAPSGFGSFPADEPVVPEETEESDDESAGAADEFEGVVRGGAADTGSLLAAWDEGREEILEQARVAALASEGEALADLDPAHLFRERHAELAGHLEDVVAAQALESAMEAAVPGLEALVEAEVRSAHSRARDLARWRTMGEAEEQIAALLDNFVWPEGDPRTLLGDREQLLASARLEAERILMHARAEAESIIVESRSQAMQDMATLESQRLALFQETRERAYAEGYTEGRAQADEEGVRLLEEATDSLNRIRLALPLAVRESQAQLVQLALQVAERIVQAEIAAKPEMVLEVLDAALARVTDMESVIIRVNPEDLPMVQAKEEQIRDLLAQVKRLEFQASVKIARGGVFIETGSGTVDATIKTQMSVLSEVFRNTQAELAGMTVVPGADVDSAGGESS